jgi:hypothetical protein
MGLADTGLPLVAEEVDVHAGLVRPKGVGEASDPGLVLGRLEGGVRDRRGADALLPLTFLSSVFMQRELMPTWIQDVARFNLVEWATPAGREAVAAEVDWGFVFANGGYLTAFALVAAWLSTRAFRAYQRSI